jgi:hypothetical protein
MDILKQKCTQRELHVLIIIMTIFYCLKFKTPQTWRARSPYPPPPSRNIVTLLYPQAQGSLFIPSYDLQGYSAGILAPFHTGFCCSNTHFLIKLPYPFKDQILKPEETATITTEWLGKQVSLAKYMHITKQGLLETVLSTRE